MRTRYIVIFLLLAISSLKAFAQKEEERKLPRILILLDESSSMLDEWAPNTPRYKAAGKIILDLMDSIYRVNDKVEFGLRVFGHQHTVQENNCYDTKREVMFSGNNYTQMQLRLADIKPLGVTPIAYALKEAAENDLEHDDRYAYSIVLLTDGGESCGGDICDVVKTMLDKKIYFKPYIVSMVDYAPLQTQYSCLGKYLQVTKSNEIPIAIDSIVKAFTPALVLTPSEYKQYQETRIMPPDALKIHNAPEVKVETQQPQTVKTIEIPVIRTVEPSNTVIPSNIKGMTIQQPVVNKQSPVTVPEVTEVRDHEQVDPITHQHITELKTPKPKGNEQTQISVPTIANTSTPVTIQKEEVSRMQHISKTTFMFPVVYSVRAVSKVKVPTMVMPKPEIEQIRPKGATIKTEITPKEAHYTVSVEESKETTVQIFFTDGHGKYYSTTPQIELDDPSGKEVKKFFRTIDASNAPDPIKIAPGSYNLSVVNGKTQAHNIKIEPNKNNKISIVVHNASLSFFYRGNEKRPVSEFEALVTLRERGGQQIIQKCTQALEYEPGNYHISINTLPAKELNGDLEMDLEMRVGIDEPGWVQFTNTNKIGKVSLYTVLGDKYLRFYSMDVNGFPESQKLRLQPGPYKVHYLKYANNLSVEENVLDFRVESAETTEIELQPAPMTHK